MTERFVADGAYALRELEPHNRKWQPVRRTRRAHRRAAPPAVMLSETWRTLEVALLSQCIQLSGITTNTAV